MSFGIGDSNKKPGIFDSFRAAMTPPELPPDDGQPIKPPTTVIVAAVLSILAGALFVFIGGYSIATRDEALDVAIADYNVAIGRCEVDFQGIGPSVVVPPGATAEQLAAAENCKGYQVLTDDLISAAKTQTTVISVIVGVLGLLAVAAGWFLRQGARWSRFGLGGTVAMLVIMTVLGFAASPLILGGTLLLIVAFMMCYIGKGGVYFSRLKARRNG